MLGCGFFSLKTWMLLTWSSGVFGLDTVTVIGTVLPFSTNGGTSSLTLPVRTVALPMTFLIAAVMVSGVAATGRRLTTGMVPIAAAVPAMPRNWRRVEPSDLRIFIVSSYSRSVA